MPLTLFDEVGKIITNELLYAAPLIERKLCRSSKDFLIDIQRQFLLGLFHTPSVPRSRRNGWDQCRSTGDLKGLKIRTPKISCPWFRSSV